MLGAKPKLYIGDRTVAHCRTRKLTGFTVPHTVIEVGTRAKCAFDIKVPVHPATTYYHVGRGIKSCRFWWNRRVDNATDWVPWTSLVPDWRSNRNTRHDMAFMATTPDPRAII